MSRTKDQHIVFICSRLDLPGGIERAIVNTANLLAKNGFLVSLLILDETKNVFYPVDPSISFRHINVSFGIGVKGNVLTRKLSLIEDIRILKRTLLALEPDFVVATEYPFAISVVLAGLKRKAKLISWEHHHYHELKKSAFWQTLSLMVYPRLHAIVCLNEDEKKHFAEHNKNVFVIPNFCTEINHIKPDPCLRKKRLLTIGRLTSVKGTDLLLQIALPILLHNPDWEWKLIGEGDLKNMVNSFIEKHSLQNQLLVRSPASPHIENEYQQASIYVMTSRNECFPMTLLEAMQQGLPCMAFNCETGPRAIIQHGVNGLLVENENVPDMINSIQQLLKNKDERHAMEKAALLSMERYSAEKILLLWQNLFNDL